MYWAEAITWTRVGEVNGVDLQYACRRMHMFESCSVLIFCTSQVCVNCAYKYVVCTRHYIMCT